MNEEVKDLENPTALDPAEPLPSVAETRPADRCGSEETPAPADAPDPSASAADNPAAERSGVPLSAAFALSERKRVRLEEAARESNQLNRSRSAGEVCQGVSGYFSYDEVKNMSRAEIRENYNNILLSMQKWH